MTTSNIDDQGRPEPPIASDEVATLCGFLDFQRATLEWKCRDLGSTDLQKKIAASSMTLGGILKHMAWHDACVLSRLNVASMLKSGDLGQLAKRTWPNGDSPSLRWILVHMIEEYARHNGHADLLRESIDGQVGE